MIKKFAILIYTFGDFVPELNVKKETMGVRQGLIVTQFSSLQQKSCDYGIKPPPTRPPFLKDSNFCYAARTWKRKTHFYQTCQGEQTHSSLHANFSSKKVLLLYVEIKHALVRFSFFYAVNE